MVVITPYDAKLAEPAVPVKEKLSLATDDPQLERLRKEGWAIKEDLGATLTLARTKGGEEKTMVHFRRKKK